MTTQTDAVLALLRSRGEQGLTPLEALELIGSFRLGARIYDLRERLGPDEQIVTERVATSSGAIIARYVLRRREPDQVTLW